MKNRPGNTDDYLNDLEDRLVEITQSEQKK